MGSYSIEPKWRIPNLFSEKTNPLFALAIPSLNLEVPIDKSLTIKSLGSDIQRPVFIPPSIFPLSPFLLVEFTTAPNSIASDWAVTVTISPYSTWVIVPLNNVWSEFGLDPYPPLRWTLTPGFNTILSISTTYSLFIKAEMFLALFKVLPKIPAKSSPRAEFAKAESGPKISVAAGLVSFE